MFYWYMYMWPESVASRGSQDIASCLLKHFSTTQSQASHLILFSDACGGQNRNINMACFCLYIVCNPDISYTVVDHKFMLSGHSYLPNDQDFGAIEKASRRAEHVYVPEDWCLLVGRARRKNAFVAVRMSSNDFVSLESVKAQIVNRKTNIHKQKVSWLNIRWIQVSKEKPYQLRYRYSLLLKLGKPWIFRESARVDQSTSVESNCNHSTQGHAHLTLGNWKTSKHLYNLFRPFITPFTPR